MIRDDLEVDTRLKSNLLVCIELPIYFGTILYRIQDDNDIANAVMCKV